MTFAVRDLMIDVLPATFADAGRLRVCENGITGNPPVPKPKPKPKPKPPKRGYAAAPAGAQISPAELAPLSVLREQLHQALHS